MQVIINYRVDSVGREWLTPISEQTEDKTTMQYY